MLTNQGLPSARTVVTEHEEADTNLIHYAAKVLEAGYHVHISSQDTDVLPPALSFQPKFGSESAVIMGYGENLRLVKLKPTCDPLGRD